MRGDERSLEQIRRDERRLRGDERRLEEIRRY